jgi:hypothetical protein
MARLASWPMTAQVGALALALMVTNALGPAGVAPFIYFRF